jgi:hypothetical protein
MSADDMLVDVALAQHVLEKHVVPMTASPASISPSLLLAAPRVNSNVSPYITRSASAASLHAAVSGRSTAAGIDSINGVNVSALSHTTVARETSHASISATTAADLTNITGPSSGAVGLDIEIMDIMHRDSHVHLCVDPTADSFHGRWLVEIWFFGLFWGAPCANRCLNMLDHRHLVSKPSNSGIDCQQK